MEKKDFMELMDGIKNLNMGLICLLRVNWKLLPEVREFYYELERSYEKLHLWVNEKERELRAQAEEGSKN